MSEFDAHDPIYNDPDAPNTPPDPFAPLDLVSDMPPPLAVEPEPAPEPAPASSAQLSLLFVVATVVLILDQASKRWIEMNLPIYETLPVLDLAPYFQFTHTTNTGAAFGLFQNAGTLFGIIAVIVGVAIIIYNFQLPAGHWALRFALGLQLGGAFGNLVDRLRQGHVTDFLNADFSSLVDVPLANVPVFNVADAAIVSGVVVLAVIMILEKPEAEIETEKETETEGEASTLLAPMVREPDESF